ncbi:MAG: hypothetical protein F9K19_22370 [Rhizobiaceae bacterium]|nr:MAG: hypothetical protein F9K19_22370 [Rhizobiaceae bacterium]
MQNSQHTNQPGWLDRPEGTCGPCTCGTSSITFRCTKRPTLGMPPFRR